MPGDLICGGDSNHLAVLANFTPSEIASPGTPFSTLFPGVDECNLIADLESGSIFSNAFTSDVEAFFGDAYNGNLFISPGPPGGNLYVLAFTDGQLIGTGTFSVVPEASTLALFAAGLLGLAATRRRRKTKA